MELKTENQDKIKSLVSALDQMFITRTLRRNLAITVLSRHGMPQIQIAEYYHLTRQRVSQILEQMEKLLKLNGEVK